MSGQVERSEGLSAAVAETMKAVRRGGGHAPAAAVARRLSADDRQEAATQFLLIEAKQLLRSETLAKEVAASRRWAELPVAEQVARTARKREKQEAVAKAAHARSVIAHGVHGITKAVARSAAGYGCDCARCDAKAKKVMTERLRAYLNGKEERARLKIEQEQKRQSAEWYAMLDDLDTKMRDILENYAAARHVEWTRELLDASFSRGDGTRVRWGAAGVDDHRARYEMFVGKATANAEGAGRHLQAIRDLEASGARCLDALAPDREGVAA